MLAVRASLRGGNPHPALALTGLPCNSLRICSSKLCQKMSFACSSEESSSGSGTGDIPNRTLNLKDSAEVSSRALVPRRHRGLFQSA